MKIPDANVVYFYVDYRSTKCIFLQKERYHHQKNSGALDVLSSCGYPYKHYSGSKHISFMDHGWVRDHFEDAPTASTFNGDLPQRQTFFENLRLDIRQFLYNSGVRSK